MRIVALLGALALAACSAQSTPATPDSVVLTQDVPYCTGKVGDQLQVLYLDIARPKGQSQALPVSLFVHGGGWAGGSKTDYRHALLALAQQNRVAVSIDYRLTPGSKFPAQLHDLKCAVRWIRENAVLYKMDTRRIVAVGGSAGAHLVALLGATADHPEFEGEGGNPTQSSRIDAMVLHGGPYDFPNLVKAVSASPSAQTTASLNSLAMLLGGPIETQRSAYVTASPVTYASRQTSPALLIHGKKDPIVPFSESTRFAERLRALGVPVTLMVIDDAGHADFGGKPDAAALKFIEFVRGPDPVLH